MKWKRYVSAMVMVGIVSLHGTAAGTNSSRLVYNSATGLVYSRYANEGQINAVNTVPDFSKAGYNGGGIPFQLEGESQNTRCST